MLQNGFECGNRLEIMRRSREHVPMPVPPQRLPGLVVPGLPGRNTGTLGQTVHVALVFPMQGPAGQSGDDQAG